MDTWMQDRIFGLLRMENLWTINHLASDQFANYEPIDNQDKGVELTWMV